MTECDWMQYFYQTGINKSVLLSDKCLNRFENYAEVILSGIFLVHLLHFQSIVNKKFLLHL